MAIHFDLASYFTELRVAEPKVELVSLESILTANQAGCYDNTSRIIRDLEVQQSALLSVRDMLTPYLTNTPDAETIAVLNERLSMTLINDITLTADNIAQVHSAINMGIADTFANIGKALESGFNRMFDKAKYHANALTEIANIAKTYKGAKPGDKAIKAGVALAVGGKVDAGTTDAVLKGMSRLLAVVNSVDNLGSKTAESGFESFAAIAKMVPGAKVTDAGDGEITASFPLASGSNAGIIGNSKSNSNKVMMAGKVATVTGMDANQVASAADMGVKLVQGFGGVKSTIDTLDKTFYKLLDANERNWEFYRNYSRLWTFIKAYNTLQQELLSDLIGYTKSSLGAMPKPTTESLDPAEAEHAAMGKAKSEGDGVDDDVLDDDGTDVDDIEFEPVDEDDLDDPDVDWDESMSADLFQYDATDEAEMSKAATLDAMAKKKCKPKAEDCDDDDDDSDDDDESEDDDDDMSKKK